MSDKKTTPERLAAFSDAVFAVIITIMVLDLKPPAEATLKALLPLWPTVRCASQDLEPWGPPADKKSSAR